MAFPEEIGRGMKKERLLFLISSHHGINDGALLVVPAIMPALMEIFHFNMHEVGTMVSLSLMVTVVFQTLAGRVSDRLHPGVLLGLGMLLMAVSMIVVTRMDSYSGLLISVMLLRVGSSVYHPVGISWISKEFHGPGADRALGIQGAMGNLGVILAMFTSGALAERFGWPVPPALWTFLCLGLFVWDALLFGMNPRRPLARPPAAAAAATATVQGRNPLHNLLWAVFPSIISGGMFTAVANFGPIFLTQLPGVTLTAAGMGIGIAWLGTGSCMGISYGRIRGRLARRPLLIMALFGASSCSMLLGWTSLFWPALAMLAVNGVFLFLIYPAIQSYISDMADPATQGKAFGYFFSLQLIGSTIISYLCGWLGEKYGAGSPFWFVGALGLICGLYCVLAVPRRVSEEPV